VTFSGRAVVPGGAEVNSPPQEGCRVSDRVVMVTCAGVMWKKDSPPLEGWRASARVVLVTCAEKVRKQNSPPLEGWRASARVVW